MLQVHTYYTDQKSSTFYQRLWCLSAPNPLITSDEGTDIILTCSSEWVDETDPLEIIVSLRPFASESIAEKRAQNTSRFKELVKEWKSERGARSSITEAATMLSYQKIIGLGPGAVPLLIDQLKSEGDHPDQWFLALMAITEENPVKPEHQGNFPKMAQDWIQWSKENLDVAW
jgi:hypothetical protein